MKTVTLDEFHEALRAQGVSSHEHFAFKCPMCETLQSGADLIAAGAGENFDGVEQYIGYSCIGRWTGKKFSKHSKGGGVGCDWTLGGLFQVHKLEVITPDGKHRPRFELATPDEAQAHMRRGKAA